MASALSNGGKVLLSGNGGSAADSQHMAAELVGSIRRGRRGLPSIALNTDASILISVGNNYGYAAVFRRQIEALGTGRDPRRRPAPQSRAGPALRPAPSICAPSTRSLIPSPGD